MKILLEVLIQWSLLIVIRIPLVIIGIFVVPIALLSAREVATQRGLIELLPDWAWIWSNDRDGSKGDIRGWWEKNAVFPGGANAFMNQWWWLAIRNPVNNMRFTRGLAVDMREATVHCLGGQDLVHDDIYGWQFLQADGPKYHYYSFYMVCPWINIRIGHKIEMWHNHHDWTQDQQKAWKGFTVRVRP